MLNAFCSVDQLISFQLTKLRQTLLKLQLSRKTNIDLLNEYLENLTDSYTVCLCPREINLFGHELAFQWPFKLMEAMRLDCS